MIGPNNFSAKEQFVSALSDNLTTSLGRHEDGLEKVR